MEVYGWVADIGRWLLPPRCAVCDEPGADGCDLCRRCREALPWNGVACSACAIPLPGRDAAGAPLCGSCLQRRPPLERVSAAFAYAAPVAGLLLRFKFHQDLAAGRVLATLMAAHCAALPRPQALVPVPLHRARLRQRGYDQALELARPIAAALSLPRCDALRRIRPTAAQSRLDAPGRRRNLRGAFGVAGPVPAHVALVDDVMTTGATLQAAALALRRAGATRVDAWVCARVP
ncbi:ComF family protein [Stenotrophomonas sp. MMGLT7]|uniref:ComF family protein n=1 Tax=Stenotrophomonas sp. MMGLT7 TaxID=2901227 RepID=UPI001E52B969|nr:ComF family protein [Stenotrophomonas sp. MMGLT7]MCD7100191.1 ComF family protein [Stenotrophomonas sp. MMGLT7]